MALKLTPTIQVESIPASSLPGNPRWMLDGRIVLVGPYHSVDEHELHIGQTIGSTEWLWSASDELLFNKESLILESVMLIIPEVTLPSDVSLASWQTAPQETGLLRLVTAQNFQLEPTDFRFIDPEGKALTCIKKSALEASHTERRLQIAYHLELLFSDDELCGWSLLHPADYVVDAWEEPSFADNDELFPTLVYEYLQLVRDPYIELMEEKDAEVLAALQILYARIQAEHSSSRRRTILRAALADKLDRFYDLEVG